MPLYEIELYRQVDVYMCYKVEANNEDEAETVARELAANDIEPNTIDEEKSPIKFNGCHRLD